MGDQKRDGPAPLLAPADLAPWPLGQGGGKNYPCSSDGCVLASVYLRFPRAITPVQYGPGKIIGSRCKLGQVEV